VKSQREKAAICKKNDCSMLGGNLFIEPAVLLTNDMVISGIGCLPIVGKPAYHILSVFFNGRWITRQATPERCWQHKDMMQESVFALGLTHEIITGVLNYALSSTVGLPPYLIGKVFNQLVLLLLVNQALHMKLPYVIANEDSEHPHLNTLLFDPADVLERINVVMLKILCAAADTLIVNLPESKEPLITLPSALQMGTAILAGNLKLPSYIGVPGSMVKGLLPAVCTDLNASQVTRPFIDRLLKDLKNIVDKVLNAKAYYHSQIRTFTKYIPKNLQAQILSTSLHLYGGIDISVETLSVLLLLNNEKDFWIFAEALQRWLTLSISQADVVKIDLPTPQVGLHAPTSGSLASPPTTISESPCPLVEDGGAAQAQRDSSLYQKNSSAKGPTLFEKATKKRDPGEFMTASSSVQRSSASLYAIH
jgi:hypothetical protein